MYLACFVASNDGPLLGKTSSVRNASHTVRNRQRQIYDCKRRRKRNLVSYIFSIFTPDIRHEWWLAQRRSCRMQVLIFLMCIVAMQRIRKWSDWKIEQLVETCGKQHKSTSPTELCDVVRLQIVCMKGELTSYYLAT